MWSHTIDPALAPQPTGRSRLTPFLLVRLYLPPRVHRTRPRSGFASDRSSPSWLIFLLSFRRHTCPKGSTLQTSVLALQPTGWFLLTVFLFLFSISYLTLGFNDTDSRHGLSACPGFAVHRPSTFDPAFDLVFAYVSMCLLSPTTIGPACPTTWRPPNRGEIVLCSRCALYAFWDLSPPLAFFHSGDLTVAISYLLGSFSVYPPFYHR